ncbi:MAG: TraB/GumN family protein [Sedimenticola sp.]|nr:TraB/GumN family protein [Sedimenticola sp.]
MNRNGRYAGRLQWFLLLLGIIQSLSVMGSQFSEGLLFRIERSGEPVGFLFGTIHSEDPRVMSLPPEVEQAFLLSAVLCLEVDMAPANLLASVSGMFLQDGRRLEEIVGPGLYERLVPVAGERGIPEVSLRHYKPWAIAVLLSAPAAETGEFLDLMLYRRALRSGKAVLGLESVSEQLDLFDTLSDQEQVNLLEEALNNLQQLPTLYQMLLERYLDRDLAGLMEINRQQMQGEGRDFAERSQVELLDRRNRRMVERLQTHLEKGGVFIAVGALHLPGEQGMLRLLQERGYRVVRKY